MLKRPVAASGESAPPVASPAQPPTPDPTPTTGTPEQGAVLPNPGARLGSILVEGGHISEAQLAEGLKKHQDEGGFLGQSLIELKYIDQQTLTLVLIKQCKIPHLNLMDYQIDPEVASIIPEVLCRKHQVLPIDKMGRILTVAMVDPLNADTLTALRQAFPDLRIKPILCDWPHYEQSLDKIFGKQDNLRGEDAPVATTSDLGLPSKPKPKPKKPEETPAPAAEAPSLEEAPKEEFAAENATPTFSLDDEPQMASHDASQPASPASPAQPSAAPAESPLQAPAENYDATLDQLNQKIGSLTETVNRIAENDNTLREREQDLVRDHAQSDLSGSGYGVGTVSQLAPHDGQTANSADARVLESLESGMPMAGYTFSNFFPGTINDVAYKTACSVSEEPGGAFNPLFVYGKVGLGKTHLINAIGNHLVNSRNDMRVGYTSASRFANHLTEARQANAGQAFRRQYSVWDVLILDDIQFLGGNIEAQEEFFHIFNSLIQQERQIIIAGDKSPEKLGLLEQRLVSRFASGMVSALHPPEWETRIEILKHNAAGANLDAPDEVFAMIAMRVANDVRMLVGALQKVMALAKLQDIPISAELTNTILTQMGIEEAA